MITDRNTVPVSIGDVRLTFSDTLEIPAKVIYIHPLHNLAVVQYDPALLKGTQIQAASLTKEPLARRRERRGGRARSAAARSSRAPRRSSEIDPLLLPLSRSVAFRDSNISVATLVNPPDDLVGRAGRP